MAKDGDDSNGSGTNKPYPVRRFQNTKPNKIRFSANKRVQAGGMAYRGKTW